MKFLLLLFLLLLTACNSPTNPEMAELTKDRRSLLVTDEKGNRYVIQHHMSNVFTVSPVNNKAEASAARR